MLSGSVFQVDLVNFLFLSQYKLIRISFIASIFQQIRNPNFDASMVILITMVSTSLLFWYCYFGKIATDSFEAMADCLYESNWQSLPIELQKYFIIMIANAQRKLYYHGFGVVKLDLEAFTKVWNIFKKIPNFPPIQIEITLIDMFCFQFFKAVFTYYMVFKTITE